ncbi:Estradiol 17-beta-dehydrogenase 8 like protein [Argiope bruennichi]|uniref:(3R)-3-hydroxyacyl-CoA dehydrogenase n=1 Tax=Argiope bruennichi TaxID=94029 RepID=A0A8T0FMZ0_ARGBR|nr:Estradiol 17-beta-dehydrogenase 8 like protein [Argiope bruennichi]
MASSLLLNGRVAIVTGGGSGIGRAVCKVFAKEGATVIAADLNEASVKETVQDISGKHFAHTVDVSKNESVLGLISRIKEECPIPNILVNCAGITRDAFMLKMSEEMFDDVIRVNLKGTFLMTQAVSRLMIESKVEAGSIVNISSVSGKIGNIGQCNYSASKAGVESFTKTVAKELAKYNIRCNAVMPGFIDTPMANKVPEKILEQVIKEIPMQRLGKPEEIADVCAFLASQRSSYVTGGIIQVSGGFVI